ncbi:MAG: recombinase family protein [Firmicutes bacterium]|nr:recombinase family protein [Bacillota bacterium]
MKNDKKMVAIYTRVSTTDQAREGHSLEEQEKRLKARCISNDYEVYKVYTDAGISGKSAENRPAYQQMLKDMKKGKFNLIMAFKMDRISRSIIDFEDFFKELKKYNCGIEFLCENIDTTGAAGMMFARILGIFAQFERELIQERTLVGVESAVNKGHFGGKPPLGYKHKLDVSGKHKLKEWEIDKDEAKIVKEIFDLCASGKTYFQISKLLKEKYPNVISSIKEDKETGEKKITYRKWNDSSISCILNNKCYMGTYEYRKCLENKDTIEIVDIVPKIISKELYNDCQEMIARNGRNYYRSKNYLFIQKLVCPHCGRIMACNGVKNKIKNDYLYYKCKDCGIYVRESLIENALLTELNNLLELSNIINSNCCITDSRTAEKYNSCKLDHKIRFAIDEKIIKDKMTLLDSNELNELWKITSYEAKCNFIGNYIDTITIKEKIDSKKKIIKVDLVNLKLKSNKVKELLDLEEKNMIDKIIGSGVLKASITEVKHDKEALDYIELLRTKYKFAAYDFYDIEDYYTNPLLFKIIKVNPKSCVEKKKVYGLVLLEYTNLLKQCTITYNNIS